MAQETRRVTEGASDTDHEARGLAAIGVLSTTTRLYFEKEWVRLKGVTQTLGSKRRGVGGCVCLQPKFLGDSDRLSTPSPNCELLAVQYSPPCARAQLGNFHPDQKGTIVFGRTLHHFTPAPACTGHCPRTIST